VASLDFAALLKPLEGAGVDYLLAQLEANKPAILADLAKAEVNATDALEAQILAAIPKQGLLQKAAAGTFSGVVKNLANQIVAQAGGENEVLWALFISEAQNFAKSLGG
jgi:hypothetical protein